MGDLSIMKIKTKRIIMILILFLGIFWNILCLTKVLDYSMYIFSVFIIGGHSIIVSFSRLFFPNIEGEKSNYIKELTQREKRSAAIAVILIIIWISTLIPCIILSI